MTDSQSVLIIYKEKYDPQADGRAILPLCSLACAQLAPRIKPSARENDIRLLCACAAMVNYSVKLRETSHEGAVTAFRAGDVNVEMTPAKIVDAAFAEAERALADAAPLLLDESFSFRQVKV